MLPFKYFYFDATAFSKISWPGLYTRPFRVWLLLIISLKGILLVDYDVMPAQTIWWEGGQQRRWPHFVGDVPAEADNDELVD